MLMATSIPYYHPAARVLHAIISKDSIHFNGDGVSETCG